MGAQTSQWKTVLNNVGAFLKGNVKSETVKKEISTQDAKKGDGVKVETEDLLNDKKSEELKEKPL